MTKALQVIILYFSVKCFDKIIHNVITQLMVIDVYLPYRGNG